MNYIDTIEGDFVYCMWEKDWKKRYNRKVSELKKRNFKKRKAWEETFASYERYVGWNGQYKVITLIKNIEQLT